MDVREHKIKTTGAGRTKLSVRETDLNDGKENAYQGEGVIIITPDMMKSLMKWNSVISRVINARFYSKYRSLDMHQPINEASDIEELFLNP